MMSSATDYSGPMMQPPMMMPQPQPVVISQPVQHIQAVQKSPNKHPRKRFANALFAFGITEVAIGGICVIFGIAAAAYAGESCYFYARSWSNISQGVWSGLFAIATGILGIIIRKKTSRCMYIANMTMGIITAAVLFTGLVLSAIAASYSNISYWYSCNSNVVLGLHVAVVILTFAAMVIAILHASFCCKGVCYKEKKPKYKPQQQPSDYMHPQYVRLPNGQIVLVTSIPQAEPVAAEPFTPRSYENVMATQQQQPDVPKYVSLSETHNEKAV